MKKFIIGLSAIAMLGFQSCSDVLDIDPSRSYSESTVYSSVKNLDLYVKDFYGIFYRKMKKKCILFSMPST